MTPRPRRNPRTTPPPRNEAAQLTDQFLAAGYTRNDVAHILARNSSLVSQFYTRNKGAAFVPALRAALQALHLGAAIDRDELRAVATPHLTPRITRTGAKARVRRKDLTLTPGHSSMARAAHQHLASGGSRLRRVIDDAAAVGGRIAFTVRAHRSAFVHDSGRPNDSLGVRRDVIQRTDGTEERPYGNSAGPGTGQAGFDARDWKARVDATGGDVTAAVKHWLVTTDRLVPGADILNLEIRGWKPCT